MGIFLMRKKPLICLKEACPMRGKQPLPVTTRDLSFHDFYVGLKPFYVEWNIILPSVVGIHSPTIQAISSLYKYNPLKWNHHGKNIN